MGRLNKPAKPNYPYRSPNQTNAEDLAPNLLEDVGASQAADMRRIGRGLSPDATPGHKFSEVNRRRQQEAGGRATLRSAGRAGLLGVAAEAGKKFGEDLDKYDPTVGPAVEKAIEKSGVGSLMRRGAVPSGRVEFSDEAEQEFANQDVERAMRVARERSDEEREERRVKTDRERALRTGAKEGYASGGFVRKADGIAQRGKTRGRFV
jgi:hypothetical protein